MNDFILDYKIKKDLTEKPKSEKQYGDKQAILMGAMGRPQALNEVQSPPVKQDGFGRSTT